MSTGLRVWCAGTPEGLALAPGRDLVLHSTSADLSRMPRGTLGDDFLDAATRAQIDARSNEALVEWRTETEELLTAEDVSLGWLFEGELYPDVFLRELHGLTGLEAALEDLGATSVELLGCDQDLAPALEARLATRGVSVTVADRGPRPSYPIAYATSVGRARPILSRLREQLGAPAVLRGEVLLMPGAVIEPLWGGLTGRGVTPCMDLANPPRAPAGTLARRLVSGGWIAHPGRRPRAAARRAVEDAVARLETADRPGDDPLGWLQRRRAAGLLADRAPEVVAGLITLRRTLRRKRLRAAVVPSDGTAAGRALIAAAGDAEVAVTHVQHGFFSDLWRLGDDLAPYVDGLTAPRAAVWSEQQRERLEPQAAGRVALTGNPAATHVPSVSADSSGPVVVLVQGPPTVSARFDRRIPERYVSAALEGIAAGRPGAEVILRPHPLDAGEYGPGESSLDVRVERSAPLDDLLAAAGACVGPVSTGTLTAAAMGVPTVHLDVTQIPLPHPFDGGGALRGAASADELSRELSSARSGESVEAACEALGVRSDAVERVVDLVL